MTTTINRPAVADALTLVYASEDIEGTAAMTAAMTHDELVEAVANLAALVHLARLVAPGLPLRSWGAEVLRATGANTRD